MSFASLCINVWREGGKRTYNAIFTGEAKCKTAVKKDQTYYRHGICAETTAKQWFPLLQPLGKGSILQPFGIWCVRLAAIACTEGCCSSVMQAFARSPLHSDGMATHVWTLGHKTDAPSPGIFYGARTDDLYCFWRLFIYLKALEGDNPLSSFVLVLSKSSAIFPFPSSPHIWDLEYLFVLENNHKIAWVTAESFSKACWFKKKKKDCPDCPANRNLFSLDWVIPI